MRIWFDSEFMEDGVTIELLSLGLIREDGETLYAEASWADHSHANDWVRQHVLPHLVGGHMLLTRDEMRAALLTFAGPNPEFWAWFASYDWVVLCQLFGRMIDLPRHWPMRVNDVAQECRRLGLNRIPPQSSVEHHALNDAQHCRAVHQWAEAFS